MYDVNKYLMSNNFKQVRLINYIKHFYLEQKW